MNFSSKFESIKWLINELYNNGLTDISRTDIFSNYYRNLKHLKYQDTIDMYRRMLNVCGYLSIANGSGNYVILQSIPENLTSTNLRAAYNNLIHN